MTVVLFEFSNIGIFRQSNNLFRPIHLFIYIYSYKRTSNELNNSYFTARSGPIACKVLGEWQHLSPAHPFLLQTRPRGMIASNSIFPEVGRLGWTTGGPGRV